MALTLNELQSLITALGLSIPENVLTQKAKAEEFKNRREKIAIDAAGKPDDWRLKKDFDDVLKRADAAAGQMQFEPAFEALDQGGRLLVQPDSLPTPPALPVWQTAKDSVDAQLNQLCELLKGTGIPVLTETANEIEEVLGNYRTKLVTALTAYDNAADGAKDKARSEALELVAAYQEGLPQDKHVIAADTNPFGVKVSIRETLGAALADLSSQLQAR